MSERASDEAIAELLALVVHDLRNPVATLGANVSFARDAGPEDAQDVQEALEDVETAIGELARGLDQLAWIGRWLGGAAALDASAGDVRSGVRTAAHRTGAQLRLSLPDEALEVRAAGNALTRLVELLARNALTFADRASIEIAAWAEGDSVFVEVRDAGRAVAADLRAHVFTVPGQGAIKGRADGRYSKVAGLVAARSLADALGAELSAGGEDGAAFFRIRLPR